MDMEDCFPPTHIRTVNHDLAVKTTRAQQCMIQDIRTVGSRNHDNSFVDAKAVHLHQQLVQGLFPFVMPAAQACATLTAHCIDFIDKHDAWRIFLGLIKQVADAGSTYAYEHFHKIGTGNGKERNTGFSGNSPGQQRFAGTGGAV